MGTPRLTAAIFVILLISAFTLGGMALVTFVGPIIVHGEAVEHVHGTITVIHGTNFTFKTTDGEKMQFECDGHCRVQLSHMQRHVAEKAPTDVYFMPAMDNGATSVAIDVD